MRTLLSPIFGIMISLCGTSAHADWQQAYSDWLNTYEAAEQILILAALTDLLGADELSTEQRETALGHLEEKALRFLLEPVPVDKCDENYTYALFDIASVVAELLADSIGEDLLEHVISITHACPDVDVEGFSFKRMPFGSEWRITYKSQTTDAHIRHSEEEFKGHIKLEPITLQQFFDGKEIFDQFVQAMGKKFTISLIKSNVSLAHLVKMKATMPVTYTTWKDAFSGWNSSCTACPMTSGRIWVEVELRNDWIGDELSNQVEALFIEKARDNITPPEYTCTWTNSRGRVTEVRQIRCPWNPPFAPLPGVASDAFPLADGTYLVDSYRPGDEDYIETDCCTTFREAKITLECIKNCRTFAP